MQDCILGIDLGNSYVSISKNNEGVVLKENNLIAFTKMKNKVAVVAVGDDVLKLQSEKNSYAVTSTMIEGKLSFAVYASEMLERLYAKINAKKSLFRKKVVVASVCLGIDEKQKQTFEQMLFDSGANEVYLIPKSLCTAIGCGLDISKNDASLIVDFGGESVEIAVINENKIITGCTLGLGGKTIDYSIVDYIKQMYNANISVETAKMIKHKVGSLYANDTNSIDVQATDIETSEEITLQVTANDVLNCCTLFLEEVVKIIKTVVYSLSNEIVTDIKRKGIIITGGFAKLTALDKFLKEKLSLNVTISENVENTTILGLNYLVNDDEMLETILQSL